MSWTKQQIVSEAFGELALAGYDFDITPEEQQAALRRMEAMLARWSDDGIRLGYVFSADPASIDAQADSGLPLHAVEPVFLNLALRQAAQYGKAITGPTRQKAKEGYDALLAAAVAPQQQQQLPSMPSGAGNRMWRWNQPFTPTPDTSPLQNGEDGGLTFRS